MPPSSHQAKRPYAGTHSAAQQSITSYFSAAPHSCTSTNPSPLSSQCALAAAAPSLPATVQSSLLTVGMRVRKSVPEGYKTGGQYSAFGLFSDAKPIQPQSQPAMTVPRRSTAYHRAELTPFCGIMKVGGLGVQSFNETNEEDVPFFSSQGSTITNASVEDDELGRGKRRFDDEEEEDGEDAKIVDQNVFGIWKDEEGSSLNGPTAGRSSLSVALGERPMAIPRGRRRGMVRQKSGDGQENSVMDVDMDFGEADFLDFGL